MYSIERFTSAFAGKVYEQTISKLLKLVNSKKADFICRLKYEHNCSGENATNTHVS